MKRLILFILAAALALSSYSQDEFLYKVSSGEVAGLFAQTKFGENDSIQSGVSEDIWSAGGVRAWLAAAETLDCVSTDADDDEGDTGARTLFVEGLDSSYDVISETITLNGTSAVTTANSYLRPYRAYVATAGSTGTNEGVITCDPTSTGSGSRQLHIDTGYGQTLQTHYTVPDGFEAYVMGAQMAVGGTGAQKRSEIYLVIRPEGGAFRVQAEYYVDTNGTSLSPDVTWATPLKLDEHTDVYWRSEPNDNNTSIFVQYSMILRRKAVNIN